MRDKITPQLVICDKSGARRWLSLFGTGRDELPAGHCNPRGTCVTYRRIILIIGMAARPGKHGTNRQGDVPRRANLLLTRARPFCLTANVLARSNAVITILRR